MRKILLGFALVLAIGGLVYLHFRHGKGPAEFAYAGEKQVTIYDSTAQVRAAVATVNFGERLQVLERFEDKVQVRTASGVVGWTAEHDLLSTDLWMQAKDLDEGAAKMPVEARGVTRVLTNLHLSPGRDTVRIRQLGKGVPVDMLERRAEAVGTSGNGADDALGAMAESLTGSSAGNSGGGAAGSGAHSVAGSAAEMKKEDWWLVRAHESDQQTLAGWVLGRFIDLDVPEPLPDYASSAGLRVVAWFELDRVKDSAGGSKAQYLVLGTHGAEGQACDFSALRAYTWSNPHQRYETAFVESDVCGKLPLVIERAAGAGGELKIWFRNVGDVEPREYVMKQTVIRRVRREGEGRPAGRKSGH